MPHKIILVRHGETDFNKQRIVQGQLDTFLNKNGVEQAKRASGLLKKENISCIYTSDLKRAHQTALIIGENLSVEVIPTSMLRERNFGKLEGQHVKKVRESFWRFFDEVETSVGYGWFDKEFLIETDNEINLRLGKFFDSIESQISNKTIAIVTHGGLIRRLLEFLGFEKKAVAKMYIHNTKIIALEKRGDKYILAEE